MSPPRKKLKKCSSEPNLNESETIYCSEVATDGKRLLFLRENVSKVLEGTGTVQCLHGCIEVYGAKLTPKSRPCRLYSFSHHKLLTVTALPSDENSSIKSVRKTLKTLNFDYSKIAFLKEKSEPSTFSIVLLCKASTEFSFLGDVERFSHLAHPRDVEVSEKSSDSITFSDEYLNVCSEWENSLEKDKTQILLLCGGKNTGKSTLARYLINRTLNLLEKVAFMECDVGQTEFIPPGCVGLNAIHEPILGPPYCHQRKPEIMYFVGVTNVKLNPVHYLECVKSAMDGYRKSYSHLPLVVNTMGWSRDLGVSILARIVEIVGPSMVVQLNGPSSRDNFPDMSPKFLTDLSSGLTDYYSFNKCPDDIECLRYSWHLLQIHFERNSSYSKNITGADFRSLSLMSYFVNGNKSSLIDYENNSNNDVPLYRLSWKKLAFYSCYKDTPRHLLVDLFNKSVCSLCIVESHLIENVGSDELPMFLKEIPKSRSLGLGYIHSVSKEDETLCIVTNICPSLMQEINCLVIGIIESPRMLLNPNENVPSIGMPYLDYPLNSFGVAPHKPKGRCVARARPQAKSKD